jgi:cytoskeletal protein CcmA (bactofilin family)
MKKIIRITTLLLLAVMVFVPLQPAAARDISFDGEVIFGQSYTLESGGSLNGDLLIFGGTATLEEASTVNGNVVLFGGSLVVNGAVTGEVAVTGGMVTIGSSAHIYGNLTTVGASLERADGAQIDGQVSNTATSWVGTGNNGSNPITPVVPVIPDTPQVPNIHFNFNPIGKTLNIFGQSLGLALLAMLLMLFLAPHADRVAHAVMAQPLTAGGLGLLTMIVAPIMLILLTITLILIPVVAVAFVALFVAGIFGWIAIGYEIGQRFSTAIHQNWHPAFSAGLGVFTLTLMANGLTSIPVLNCVGWLVPFLLGLAGLGAVLLTRFGTQSVFIPSAIEPRQPAPVALSAPIPPVAPESGSSAPEPAMPKRKPRNKNSCQKDYTPLQGNGAVFVFKGNDIIPCAHW